MTAPDAPLIPALRMPASAIKSASPPSRGPLPLPILAVRRASATIYGSSSIDNRGRLVDAHIMRQLAWLPDLALTLTATRRVLLIDLADMRFACSPLLETATSLWTLYEPSAHVLHLPWIRQTRSLLQDWPDRELLMSPVAPRVHWLPDFLTPRPTSPLPDIDDELRRVRSTQPRRAVAHVRNAYAGQPLPTELERLCERPRQLRDRLAEVLTTYWSSAVEPHWPRMRAVLEADMVHRARLLARDGAAAVLTGLDRVLSGQTEYCGCASRRTSWTTTRR